MKKLTASEEAAAAIAQFAAKGGPRCLSCTALKDPRIREVVDQIREQLGSLAVISKYLESKGHKVTANAVGNHFREHEGKR